TSRGRRTRTPVRAPVPTSTVNPAGATSPAGATVSAMAATSGKATPGKGTTPAPPLTNVRPRHKQVPEAPVRRGVPRRPRPGCSPATEPAPATRRRCTRPCPGWVGACRANWWRGPRWNSGRCAPCSALSTWRVWSPPTTPGGEGTPARGRRAGHRRRSASPAPPRDAGGSRAAAARELAVVGGAGDGGGMEALPEDLSALLEEYGRHLRLGRNRSEHTVRAYVGDARALLGHLYARSADS